ncbi:unnamed protein product [Somion occarium]|uniref:Uncharacterized protein n=1 Tax=Somion occarium TaxID=3059160 RepID=A0ABP1DX44_9APHY
MSRSGRRNPRSSTGYVLLPASNAASQQVLIPIAPTKTLLSWTFGRGTVIWRIWPAVLLHTAFAAAVVSVSLTTRFKLGIPNVMLTLLGVVIGFVISYRASSGYERYWQGRSYWSDVMRTSRTFGRLIWFHVPLRAFNEDGSDASDDPHGKKPEKARQVRRIMAEKRMALHLVEAFSVALKHHLRGEVGLYYEDLYHLHTHHSQHQMKLTPSQSLRAKVPIIPSEPATSEIRTSPLAGPSTQQTIPSDCIPTITRNPVIPPINAYGTFPHSMSHHLHRSSSSMSSSSTDSSIGEGRLLLPGHVPRNDGMMSKVSSDLIPFANIFGYVARSFLKIKRKVFGRSRASDDVENGTTTENNENGDNTFVNADDAAFQRRWAESGRISAVPFTHTKHRPRIAGGGENVPLQVVRCLSHWLSVMEARDTVPGNTLANMFGCLNNLEDSLSGLERILTTPLPFVFSVHISTVWIYLFFLPFQLVDLFEWYTIPGVGIAAFIYLGFAAAGEEIEQPFGYDENDLDLDMFCREVIHADFEHLKKTPCMNVFLGSPHRADEVTIEDPLSSVEHGRVEDVFGHP